MRVPELLAEDMHVVRPLAGGDAPCWPRHPVGVCSCHAHLARESNPDLTVLETAALPIELARSDVELLSCFVLRASCFVQPWPAKEKPPARLSWGRCPRSARLAAYVADTLPLISASFDWHADAFGIRCSKTGDQVFTVLL